MEINIIIKDDNMPTTSDVDFFFHHYYRFSFLVAIIIGKVSELTHHFINFFNSARNWLSSSMDAKKINILSFYYFFYVLVYCLSYY